MPEIIGQIAKAARASGRLSGASFTVNGAPMPPNSALTTAGAQLFFSANWSLLAKFEGEFANGSQTCAGSGILRYTW